MAKIIGIDSLTHAQLESEIGQGGKFVIYQYCFSIVVMTFKRGTDIYYIKPGENAVVKGLPWTFLSLVVGWWGFPWGLIYTPIALFTNLSGGKNVTREVLSALAPLPAASPPPPGYDLGLDNPW